MGSNMHWNNVRKWSRRATGLHRSNRHGIARLPWIAKEVELVLMYGTAMAIVVPQCSRRFAGLPRGRCTKGNGDGHRITWSMYAEGTADCLKRYAQRYRIGCRSVSTLVMYNEGAHAQALTWYRKAADQGDADAQIALGLMYE